MSTEGDQGRMAAVFSRMHAATRAEISVAYEVRTSRLQRLLEAIRGHAAAIELAISADFGHRPVQETRLAELMPVEASIKHASRNLRRWMQPKRVPTGIAFWPGVNRLLPQPLGVAGIISPWNYPLQLALAPAVGAIAAGNRVMIKPSELTPAFSEVMERMIGEAFADDEVFVVTGDATLGRAFSSLPFDHLLFTGSTRVGRLVAAAAAPNLTPVTLELGGKSPALLHESADITAAARRIAYAKLLNAGQTCVAPDHVICQRDQQAPFASAYAKAVRRMIGPDPTRPDYASIISEDHLRRLRELIADAAEKGARIEWPAGDPSVWNTFRKQPPCLVFDTTPDMRVRQEEIFGPILPVVVADTLSDAITLVNAGDRPLALYWFGTDQTALTRVLHETLSGGVTVNDCILHLVQEHQPFGGVGASGSGAYHGEWGFRTFSKEKPVFYRSALNGFGFMQPPYGTVFDRALDMIRRMS